MAFAILGSFHCKVPDWVCKWVRGLARVLSHFKVKLGDGNCENDFGENEQYRYCLLYKILTLKLGRFDLGPVIMERIFWL